MSIPFEISRSGAFEVASNGSVSLMLDGAGSLKRLRAIKGIMKISPQDVVLPKLNDLAGRLLNETLTVEQVNQELIALAGLIPSRDPERVEWAVAELDGVYVYTDGKTIFVSKNGELHP